MQGVRLAEGSGTRRHSSLSLVLLSCGKEKRPSKARGCHRDPDRPLAEGLEGLKMSLSVRTSGARGRGTSLLEDPQAFCGSGVGSQALLRVFSIFLHVWPSLPSSKYFNRTRLGCRPHLLNAGLPFLAFHQLLSSLAKVVRLACGVLPSSRDPGHGGVTLSRLMRGVRLRLCSIALAPCSPWLSPVLCTLWRVPPPHILAVG